jgi:predicted Zn-dependent protease
LTLAAAAALLLSASPADAGDCTALHGALEKRYESAVQGHAQPEQQDSALDALENAIFDALDQCPGDYDLLKLMGETQIAAGRGPIAIAYGNKLIDLRPDYFAGHLLLGAALMTVGKSDEGVRHMKNAEELAPENLAVKLNLCSALAESGRKTEAIEYCDAVAAGDDARLRDIATSLRSRLH